MKSKFIAGMLAMTMAAGLLAGCGRTGETPEATDSSEEAVSREDSGISGSDGEDPSSAGSESVADKPSISDVKDTSIDVPADASGMYHLFAQFAAPNGEENTVCSPLNIELAMILLAECTGGSSQAQILDALGYEDMESARKAAQDLYVTYNYEETLNRDYYLPDFGEEDSGSGDADGNDAVGDNGDADDGNGNGGSADGDAAGGSANDGADGSGNTGDSNGTGDVADDPYADKDLVSKLSNSLWINENADLNQSALGKIAADHDALIESGDPASDKMNHDLQQWLDEATGGLLREQAAGVKLGPATVLALASAIYYKAPWASSFEEAFTEDGTFHAAGGDVTVPMMHQTEDMSYYRGQNFTAVALDLMDRNQFWILLPNEGKTPSDLLVDPEAAALLQQGAAEYLQDAGSDAANSDSADGIGGAAGSAAGTGADALTSEIEYPEVNLTMPKMDVTMEKDLIAGLRELGITDVFSDSAADFSPILNGGSGLAGQVEVSKIQHDARLTADEDGIVAAAFTVAMMETTAFEPSEPIDFTADRPYLYAVTGTDGSILFGGVMQNPAE